jgi:hypothetical protein
MTNATEKNAKTFEVLPVCAGVPSSGSQLVNMTFTDATYTNKTITNSISYTGTLSTLSPFNVSYLNYALTNTTTTLMPAYNCTIFFENLLTTLTFNDTGILSNFNLMSATALTSLSGPNITAFTGVFQGTLPALTTFSFPNVVYIASFAPTCAALTTLSLPSLVYFANSVTPTAANLTTLNLPLLQQCLLGFAPVFASLTTFSLPALTYSATFSPTLASCTTLSVPVLSIVGSNVVLVTASLTTLSLPALTIVGGTFTITAANMTTFSMNSGLLSIGGNFTMSGMKLDAASVNGILVSLAALDGTGGTTAYSSKTINISGGTSAAPSGAGATAKTTLQGRGCTVTTN